MSKIAQMTGGALASLVQAGGSPDELLNVVAVRLLAIALRVMTGRPRRLNQVRLAIPQGYRLWPMIEAEAGTGCFRQRLKVYVCPKGAATMDDEPFSVGTVLVVENLVLPNKADGPPTSVFLMEKFACIRTHGESRAHQDGWAYATYNSIGPALRSISTVCGVCRLLFM